MYAAGHPPLPNFELGLVRQNMPPHWREQRHVPAFQEAKGAEAAKLRQLYQLDAADTHQARFVLAGSLEAVHCALDLTAQRADLGAAEGLSREQRERRWPELTLKYPDLAGQPLPALWPQVFMGHADCYACHHDLAIRSWRQIRGYSGPPGRPQVRPWPLALARQGLGVGDEAAAFQKHIASLHAACNDRPYGDPGKLFDASQILSQWSDGRLRIAPKTVSPAELLEHLCKLAPDQYPDYDSARQIAAAIWVIYGEWAPRVEKGAEIREVLDKLAEEFDLQANPQGRKDRIDLILSRVLTAKEQKELLDPAGVNGLLALPTNGLKALPQEKQQKVKALLGAIRNHAGPDMTRAILDNPGPFLQRLHEPNERELTEAMHRVNDYDPTTFKERLNRLATLLPKAGR
jgi:hypothetical protein